VPLSSCVTDKHYGDLVKQLCGDKAFDDTTILICRHHGKIIELANALLTDNDTSAMPKLSSASCWPTAWPSAGFDPTPVRSSR
jgi:hypothetical protein